jgi:hypothetical protein
MSILKREAGREGGRERVERGREGGRERVEGGPTMNHFREREERQEVKDMRCQRGGMFNNVKAA